MIGYYLFACSNRWGTICPRVQIDRVLFVRMCKSTGYYLSACAKMTGYYLSEVLFVCYFSYISRSQGKKIGSQNAIFKDLLVRNYKAQSFHIKYIT